MKDQQPIPIQEAIPVGDWLFFVCARGIFDRSAVCSRGRAKDEYRYDSNSQKRALDDIES